MKYLRGSKLFAALIFIILFGIVVVTYDQVSFLFTPLEALFASLFTPVIIAGFLYYIFLPIFNLLNRKISSRGKSLLLLFILIFAILYLFFSLVMPSVVEEFSSFVAMLPGVVDMVIDWLEETITLNNLTSIDVTQYIQDFDISIADLLTNVTSGLTVGLTSVFSFVTQSVIILTTVPVTLFFLFKDGEKLPNNIVRFIPKKYKKLSVKLMEVFHENAAAYIGGRILVCLYVAFTSYIIFLILGIPNALLLGIICGIFDIIPYFGPFIGALPAFLISLTISFTTAVILVIAIIIIQLGESHIVSPLVMGRTLQMHPLTVVFLVLFANQLIGLVGMILILPFYAILRACAHTIYDFYQEQKKENISLPKE